MIVRDFTVNSMPTQNPIQTHSVQLRLGGFEGSKQLPLVASTCTMVAVRKRGINVLESCQYFFMISSVRMWGMTSLNLVVMIVCIYRITWLCCIWFDTNFWFLIGTPEIQVKTVSLIHLPPSLPPSLWACLSTGAYVSSVKPDTGPISVICFAVMRKTGVEKGLGGKSRILSGRIECADRVQAGAGKELESFGAR